MKTKQFYSKDFGLYCSSNKDEFTYPECTPNFGKRCTVGLQAKIPAYYMTGRPKGFDFDLCIPDDDSIELVCQYNPVLNITIYSWMKD